MKIRKTEFHNRLYRRLDELKWLYMELYRDEEAFDYFVKMLQSAGASGSSRSGSRTQGGRATPAGTAAGTCWA